MAAYRRISLLWPAFDGLAGPRARAARKWLASGSLIASTAARKHCHTILIARAILALLRGTLAAPPGAAADRRGGCQGSAQRLSARFIATKNPDGERPAFWETGF